MAGTGQKSADRERENVTHSRAYAGGSWSAAASCNGLRRGCERARHLERRESRVHHGIRRSPRGPGRGLELHLRRVEGKVVTVSAEPWEEWKKTRLGRNATRGRRECDANWRIRERNARREPEHRHAPCRAASTDVLARVSRPSVSSPRFMKRARERARFYRTETRGQRTSYFPAASGSAAGSRAVVEARLGGRQRADGCPARRSIPGRAIATRILSRVECARVAGRAGSAREKRGLWA